MCRNWTIFVHLAYWHSGSAGPIFAIFTQNESVLSVDDRSGPLFMISQGTLPRQPIFGKICEMTFIHFKTGCTIVMGMHALIASLITLHRLKMVKIGSVVFELKWGIK